MKTRKIAYLGMLMALALVLSYVESLIPFAVGIPGVKLGLTNIVTVSISLVGGVCHNIGKIIVAAIVLSTYSVVYYIPVLLVAGCITGLVIGTVASQVLLRISDSFHV